MSCPLCKVWEREPENVLWQNRYYALVRTKHLKGHKERLMFMSKKHIKFNHDTVNAINSAQAEIKKAFAYTYSVIVMEGTYGSVPDHWHVCITDLEEGSEDHQQILGTPWIGTIKIKPWREKDEEN